MISRTPLLTYLPVTGQYRYRDVLQIIPPQPGDPRPETPHGWHGVTLAVAFEESAAPLRTRDHWAHDHRERARVEFLTSQVESGIGSHDWLDTAMVIQGTFFRRRAIEHEALRLLQVLTNNSFRQPTQTEHNWYLDKDSGKPVYAPSTYPSFVTDQWGEFWTGQIDSIPISRSC